MSTSSDMLRALRSRDPGRSLARDFYVSDDWFELELEHIFHKEWMFAGHSCEIANSGDYFTLQLGRYALIVTRDREGAVRAHHNTCRHRGFKICEEPRGSVKRFVCPYHQWSYEVDGTLARTRAMKQPGFDPAGYGLKPAHAAEVCGYIFVSVGAEAPDFSPVRDLVEPYFTPYQLADAKVAFEETIVEDGNWKLVMENNRECYHCAGSHPELCRTFPEAFSGTQGMEGDAVVLRFWDDCESRGLPSRFRMADSGQYRATRVPLLDAARSYTMTGAPAVTRRLGQAPDADLGSLLFFHFPTTWNHLLGDHAISFRLLPLDAKRTALTTKWLVHKDAVEGRDYDIETLTEVWRATNLQDAGLVARNQRGIDSPAYSPGPCSAEYEQGVVQFVDWYAGLMERRLGGAPAAQLRKVG